MSSWPSFKGSNANKSGILLLTELQDRGYLQKHESCQLYYRSQDNVRYSMPIKKGENRHLMVLDPGKYRFESLSCNMINEFELNDLPRFTVTPGRVSYIGQLSFKLANNGDLNWRPVFHKQANFRQNFSELSPSVQSRLVNGYTQKKITSDLVEESREKPLTKVSVKSSTGKKSFTPNQKIYLMDDFDSCYKQEMKKNLVKIGHLEYRLHFSKRALTRLKKSGEGTFSPRYAKCLESILKDTKVLVEENVVINVHF